MNTKINIETIRKKVIGKTQEFFSPDHIKIILLYFISRISLLFFGYIVHDTPYIKAGKANFFHFLVKADADWFLKIINNGYDFSQQKFSSSAFSPLYPYLIKSICFFTGHPVVVGIIISNTATIIGLILFYHIVKQEYGKETAINTVMIFIVFPVSFFYSLLYAEGLFFMLSVLSYYLWKKERYTWACVAAGLATLTKVLGIFLVIPFFISTALKYYKSTKISNLKKTIIKTIHESFRILIIPFCLFIQAFILFLMFGRFDILFASQLPWRSKIVGIGQTLVYSLKSDNLHFYSLIFFILFFILLLILTRNEIDIFYTSYAATLFVFLLSINQTLSFLRHFSAIFPFYLMCGITMKDDYWKFFLLTFFAFLQAFMFAAFVNNFNIY